jgi:hypothetical protein
MEEAYSHLGTGVGGPDHEPWFEGCRTTRATKQTSRERDRAGLLSAFSEQQVSRLLLAPHAATVHASALATKRGRDLARGDATSSARGIPPPPLSPRVTSTSGRLTSQPRQID